MNAISASAFWNEKYKAPGAITDDLGPIPESKARVAIKKLISSPCGTRTSKPSATSC